MNYNISSSFSLDDIQRAQAAGDAIIANQFTIDAKIPDHCTTIFGLVYASNTEPLSDDVQQYQLLKRQPKAVEGSPSLVAIVRITKRKRNVKLKFAEEDLLLFKSLIAVCTSLNACFISNDTKVKTDVRGVRSIACEMIHMLLPLFFEKCLRVVDFDGHAQNFNSSVQLTVCTVAHWLKMLHVADVVLIRLNSNSFLESTNFDHISYNSSKNQHYQGELVFSSDEINSSLLHSSENHDKSALISELNVAIEEFALLNPTPVAAKSSIVESAPLVIELFDSISNTASKTLKAIGEVQLFKNQASLTNDVEAKERNDLVLLICYSLARVLSLRNWQSHLLQEYQLIRDKNIDLVKELNSSDHQINVEAQTASVWKQKLSGSIALNVFAKQTSDIATPPLLAYVIEKNLPMMLGCKAVVLLLALPQGESTQKVFRIVLSNIAENSNSDKYNHMIANMLGVPSNSLSNYSLLMSQLATVPDYVDLVRNADPLLGLTEQAKILLCKSNSPVSDSFGVLLLLPLEHTFAQSHVNATSSLLISKFGVSESSNDKSSMEAVPSSHSSSSSPSLMIAWEGLEEVLVDCLGNCIYSCIGKFEFKGVLEKVKQTMKDCEILQLENKKVEVEYHKLSLSRDELQSKHDSALAEIENLKAQLALERESHAEELKQQKIQCNQLLNNNDLVQEQHKAQFNELISEAQNIQNNLKEMLQLQLGMWRV